MIIRSFNCPTDFVRYGKDLSRKYGLSCRKKSREQKGQACIDEWLLDISSHQSRRAPFGRDVLQRPKDQTKKANGLSLELIKSEEPRQATRSTMEP